MKILLLIILIVGLIIIYNKSSTGPTQKLIYLNNAIQEITSNLNISIKYHLHVSDTTTYIINKHDIYLVIWNDVSNMLYDDNTLMHALIHEIAHIIDNSQTCHWLTSQPSSAGSHPTRGIEHRTSSPIRINLI